MAQKVEDFMHAVIECHGKTDLTVPAVIEIMNPALACSSIQSQRCVDFPMPLRESSHIRFIIRVFVGNHAPDMQQSLSLRRHSRCTT